MFLMPAASHFPRRSAMTSSPDMPNESYIMLSRLTCPVEKGEHICMKSSWLTPLSVLSVSRWSNDSKSCSLRLLKYPNICMVLSFWSGQS